MISPTLIPVNCFSRPDDGTSIGSSKTHHQAQNTSVQQEAKALQAMHQPDESISEQDFQKAAKILLQATNRDFNNLMKTIPKAKISEILEDTQDPDFQAKVKATLGFTDDPIIQAQMDRYGLSKKALEKFASNGTDEIVQKSNTLEKAIRTVYMYIFQQCKKANLYNSFEDFYAAKKDFLHAIFNEGRTHCPLLEPLTDKEKKRKQPAEIKRHNDNIRRRKDSSDRKVPGCINDLITIIKEEIKNDKNPGA